MSTRTLVALAAATFVAVACTSEEAPPPLPSTTRAADAFVRAWAAGDHAEMTAALTDASGAKWTPERLERWMDRRLANGDISSYRVTRTTTPAQPERSEDGTDVYPDVSVGYRISYQSEATPETLSLEGEFDMEWVPEDSRWGVAFEPSSMWPGVGRAADFDVLEKWPRRGWILDRDGRVLASGSGGDRDYPFGSLAGSTIGHVEALEGPSGGLHGGSGLEFAYEEHLAGTPSTRLAIVDRKGRVLRQTVFLRGERGRTLRTTLDVEIQRAAAQGFGSTIGGAVVIQPATGDILAVVDPGTFDPNGYVGATDVSPFNRALVGRYPPGSTMKVVTAAAALETGTVTPQTTVTGPKECKGVRNFESGQFGEIPFADALKFSVNTAFAQVAEDLGADRLSRFARRFGFSRPSRLGDLVAESQFPEPVGLGDVMWSSIGQAQVLATPLQMASVAATIANGGVRMEPRLSLGERERSRRAVSAETAAQVRAMMESVVQGGTGVNAQISGVSVAGKTGTAEVDVAGERKNHAWFIAFAPASGPSVAVAVVSEFGGTGGSVAAPIARRILNGVLPVAP